ncbi:serine hydrolase [Virgibacillus dakarensis]|uniref:Serine hydrolase n=1 Tax=Lentibacillus populi TaxID=1827502 RepID=A0A9W5TW66_9BACI|nr:MULTISPECIES: serine hydrolase [Bacillaceae]MBT2217318.1 serine hydrolase [Virgibacillus dakarensis]MTW86748.1 serine hydrolase [Virgibacillus dakarensis]GGB38074.1 serine hydrolase [Lentibacillus populi]
MSLSELEAAILNKIDETIDHFSILIKTKSGDIAINACESIRAASMIKIPILIEAYRQIERNLLDPETSVDIESEKKAGGAGVINYLTNVNGYSYQNLLELMIIVSDNTAANLLLEKIGVQHVNKFAAEIGLYHTKIGRKFMDQKAIEKGRDNYTCAYDMVQLLSLIAEPNKIVNDDSRKQMLRILYYQQFKQKLPAYLHEGDGIDFFHKTGELPGIEHDAAIISNKGDTIYAAILTQNWVNNGIGRDYIADIGRLLINYLKN